MQEENRERAAATAAKRAKAYILAYSRANTTGEKQLGGEEEEEEEEEEAIPVSLAPDLIRARALGDERRVHTSGAPAAAAAAQTATARLYIP